MEYNKKIKYIYVDQEYSINLYTNIDIDNYIKIYIDNTELIIPLVEINDEKASHIRIYKDNRIYAWAFSL